MAWLFGIISSSAANWENHRWGSSQIFGLAVSVKNCMYKQYFMQANVKLGITLPYDRG